MKKYFKNLLFPLVETLYGLLHIFIVLNMEVVTWFMPEQKKSGSFVSVTDNMIAYPFAKLGF